MGRGFIQMRYEMWWTEYAVLNLKKSTHEGYEKMKPAIMEVIGHLKLSKVQPHHLNEFYTNIALLHSAGGQFIILL